MTVDNLCKGDIQICDLSVNDLCGIAWKNNPLCALHFAAAGEILKEVLDVYHCAVRCTGDFSSLGQFALFDL